MPDPQLPPTPQLDPVVMARAREAMRHALTSAPPTGDQVLDEMRQRLANGQVRGRDLLADPTFRAHVSDGMTDFLRMLETLEPEERDRLLGRADGENDPPPARDRVAD